MGNQLVGVAPSQIFPVEHYLTDYGELQFDISMGSTRFFKVARAKSQEGLVVVKVFAIHDPSLPLSTYRERLEYIREKLASAVNCLPFQSVVLTDRAGLIMREYVKHSLYDRISTRPFLTVIEKKWITFQVLYALHQCHKLSICHGDIKLENILITSWNWVLLGDFASFKPTYLPEDNPADYSYFFDTSRRRICYIAPERFVKSLNNELPLKDGFLVNETPCSSGDLLPSMDIFSAGCALLELWNEGTPPFELSQLLAYRTGEYQPNRHLESISDTGLRSLLASMIHREPQQRLSAEFYLDRDRGGLFPEYFYSFLQSYMLIYSASPILPPDEKILRLHQDIGNIINIFTKPIAPDSQKAGNHPKPPTEISQPEQKAHAKSEKSKKSKAETHSPEKKDREKTVITNESEGLIIITSLVTSCIRGLHHCTSKINCLDILLQLAAHTSSETILDRILPYILQLAHDLSPRVRVSALDSLTRCLCLVKDLPRSDYNVFPEYVLPAIAPLATDNSVMVRSAYAKNIAVLAETALQFLDQTQKGNDKETAILNFETELCALHEMIQQTVSSLLADPQSIVKQTLMESGITKLCVFFGKQKANDVILSHMITFLNDKEDRHLRGSFFDCIVGVAAYVGWHCSYILTPLLQQGLTDSSEFVIAKSIRATTALTELGLLQKPSLTEFISESACYLNHPNMWIRHEMCGLISTAARILSPIDVQCKIMTSISPHLKSPLIQVEKPAMLLESLQQPIPRIIFDSVVKFPDINNLIETLRERRVIRAKVKEGTVPQYSEMGSALRNLFRRLTSDGLTDHIENQLLSMSAHLIKLNKYRANDVSKKQQSLMVDGRLELSNGRSVKKHVINLALSETAKSDIQVSNARKIKKPTDDLIMNSEWQHMFGGNSTASEGPILPTTINSAITETSNNMSMVEHSLPERSYVQYRVADCRLELRALSLRQQEKYLAVVHNRELAEQAQWRPALPHPGWRLRGTLVAHLHEHRGAVTKVAALPDLPMFASCSLDGTVKLWDCAKMESHNVANRSKLTYNGQCGPLTCLAVCDSKQSLGVASQDGSVVLLRLDKSGARLTPIQVRQLDSNEDGCAVDMHYLDAGSSGMLVYATLYGALVGWDLRAPGTAWRLENDLKHGVITSFCLDSNKSWLALGTSSGRHVCWDLRFRLPISSITHPKGAQIHKIICHPTEPSWVLSSVQGNNEVSMWNIETGFRQSVLWASSAPPLSNTQVSTHSVSAMHAGCVDRTGFLLAGGTDQRIRYWNLDAPEESYLAIPAPNDSLNLSTISYENRLIDGTSVVQETVKPLTRPSGEETPRAGPEPPPAGHHDALTDLAMVQASQCLLISAARDGVIKVWK